MNIDHRFLCVDVFNIAKKTLLIMHPILSTNDDACPFYLITGPTCRYARFASLASCARGAVKAPFWHGRPTNERCDVRSAGVADWKTALGGDMERTLTAAAGPSPRDPYRHALTMRPPRKVRPFCFFNFYTPFDFKARSAISKVRLHNIRVAS